MGMSIGEAAENLCVALLLGAAIGLERQWSQRLASLRTNTLVALGAASFVLYGRLSTDTSGARIAAQVVSGVGFLGAGLIFKDGFNVRGLNTAATLWCSAAVGLLAGGGSHAFAALAAGLVIGANVALRPLVNFINHQPEDSSEQKPRYTLSFVCRPSTASDIRARLAASISEIPETRIVELKSAFLEDSDEVEINVELACTRRREIALETLVADQGNRPGVLSAGWRENDDAS